MPEADLCRALGLELARRRTALGLSQQAVARRAGTSHTTIGRIERGECLPRDPALLARVGAALGLGSWATARAAGDLAVEREAAAAWAALGARERGLRHIVPFAFDGVALDRAAERAVLRALLAIRRELGARQAP